MTRLALKWINENKKYIPYELPDGAVVYSNDMDKIVNCCKCGKPIKYGESYTSRTIHTEMGIGFAECSECYYNSLKEEFDNED